MRHSLRPRWMLVALAVVAWTGVADAASDGTVELGGGFTWTRLTLDPEVSGAEVDDVDTRGYYVTVRFVARHGGQVIGAYEPVEAVIGEFDPDLFFVVEWPSWDVFQGFLADPEYQAVRHLREEALVRSLLIRSKEPRFFRPR